LQCGGERRRCNLKPKYDLTAPAESPSLPSFLPPLSLSHSPSLIMSAPPPHPISPPPGLVGSEPQSSTVRRHHTITAASRSARAAARAPISEESQEQQAWDDEEVADPERVRSVGAVGEKGGSLHRQASLPARYNRGTSLNITPSQSSFTSCITDNLFPSLRSCIPWIR
jgi:hypothetical protein